mgnify:CR=1 FL=1
MNRIPLLILFAVIFTGLSVPAYGELITDHVVINEVDTNIVVVDVSGTGMTSEQFVEGLKKKGILAVTFGPTLVRFTTHFDVSMDDMERVSLILREK